MQKKTTSNLSYCSICPRQCCVDRNLSFGFCKEKQTIRIAKIIKNFKWEEPCITGEKGALAIFFSGCNLRCDYCQNYKISRGQVGKEYSIDEFVSLIEENKKTHDYIDLITPTHFATSLKIAFSQIKKTIPVIWNTNSYESEETIKSVSPFVDIFLADLKYGNDELGKKFSACNNYFSAALPAIKQMCKQKPDVMKDELMLQGVIIRHLVLPGYVANSINVLNIINDNFPTRKISIMSQFVPNGNGVLKRKLRPIEYKAVLTHMQSLELSNGYIQDFASATDDFIPDFD